MASRTLATDVVIVGAGPTGLMLALVLAKLGIDHVIIDSKQGATVESRAIGVQARTLEICEQLGLVDEVLKQGTRATAISPGYLKKALANIPLGNLGGSTTKYPYIENFEQNKNERLLIGALRKPGSEVLWEHALDGLEVAASGDPKVTARLSGGLRVQLSPYGYFCICRRTAPYAPLVVTQVRVILPDAVAGHVEPIGH